MYWHAKFHKYCLLSSNPVYFSICFKIGIFVVQYTHPTSRKRQRCYFLNSKYFVLMRVITKRRKINTFDEYTNKCFLYNKYITFSLFTERPVYQQFTFTGCQFSFNTRLVGIIHCSDFLKRWLTIRTYFVSRSRKQCRWLQTCCSVE